MAESLLRTDREIVAIYNRHLQTVYRVCFAYMKNAADTEDAVSDTFIKMLQSDVSFENENHEKAWLIRTAGNVCKNKLKHWWRKNEPLDMVENVKGGQDDIAVDETFAAVMALPDKYKTVVHLYYYEQYTGAEIAEMLQKPHSTIRNYLHEARKLLHKKLGGEFYE
ncbi:MAG: RNA polymerase sigma factor [Oscillospiraceae bacterium]|jgi:RNA polymerase sigma-70 factor (ECF subfamily)|nr:RNA polymerase sigma factor [Oscillospiraceae bacterium]